MISQPIEPTLDFQINSSTHNYYALSVNPTYCVRHENKKVQNRNDIPHFSFKILAED